jgi:hypothetical protein
MITRRSFRRLDSREASDSESVSFGETSHNDVRRPSSILSRSRRVKRARTNRTRDRCFDARVSKSGIVREANAEVIVLDESVERSEDGRGNDSVRATGGRHLANLTADKLARPIGGRMR